MTESRHWLVALAATLLLLGTLVVGLIATPAAAQSAEPTLGCVGTDGGTPYLTDSGLTVYENDTEATMGIFYFPDSETVRFEYQSDAVNISAAGDSEARLENGTGETTCLGDIDTTSNDVTVSPDGENNITLSGTYEGISFRDVNFSVDSDTTDIAYDASDPAALTLHGTGLPEGTIATAVDDTGDELDTASVAADGSVTFDSLPSGQQDIDLSAEIVDDVTAEIDGDSAPTVVANTEQAIDVAVTDPDGDGIEDQRVTVDSIDDGGDGVTVDGLAESDTLQTDANGEGTFSGVTFDGEPDDTVNVTVSAEDGTSQTLNVTLEAGEPAAIAANVSADDAVANGSDKAEFTVSVTDANDNLVEGATVQVDDAEDVSDLGGISADDAATTDASGEATFNATSTDSGEFTLQFSESNAGSDSATATFEAGEPEAIDAAVTTDQATADGTDEVAVTATLADANDNPVEGATIEVDDAENVSDLGGISAGDTATTDASGEATFTATSTDSGEFILQFSESDAGSDSATATFEPGDVDSIDLSPDSDQTLTAGDSLQFSATAYDEYDNVFEDSESGFDWQHATDGVFTETDAGEYEVIAELGGVQAATTVTVEVGSVDSVELSPDDDQTTEEGESIEFSATATDEFGNVIETTETAFDWENADDDGIFQTDSPGTYDVTATFDGTTSPVTTVAVESISDPDPEPEPATFEISELSLDPADATPAETVTASVTVTNDGGTDKTQTVELAVDGTVEEQTSVALDEGETETVSFEFDAPQETGGYEVEATSDDDSETSVLAVEPEPEPDPEPATFELSNFSLDQSAVDPGETITLTSSVTNNGEVDDEQAIDLLFNGSVKKQQSLSLSGGQTENVIFEITAPQEPGEYDIMGRSEADTETSMVVVEPEPAAFTIEAVDLPAESVTPGEEITVTATINNPGQQETQDVVATLDELTDRTELSLDGEDTVTLTVAVPEEPGEYDLTLSTDDDEKTETVFVEDETGGDEDNASEETETRDSDDGEGPGFGVITVLVALVAAVILARRT